jgi:hypothetical protein
MLLTACSCTAAPGDDDDTTAEPEEDWDPGEPSVPDGSRLYGILTCSIFDAPMDKGWQKQEDHWVEIPGFTSTLRPGLEACTAASERTLLWGADGSITFLAGGWEHRLGATETEDLWIGEAEPLHEVSASCLDALEGFDLGLPVPLSFERTEVVVP